MYLRMETHDGVIAFGGGSSLDVGKSIVLQAALNRPLWDCTDGGSVLE